MEDVLTDVPPPSRFLPTDLNNFTPRRSLLPPPILVLPNPPPPPPLLLILLHSPSLLHLPPSTLLGSLILPEHPLSTTAPSPIHSLGDSLILTLTSPVPPERAAAVGRALMGIKAERVVVVEEGSRAGKVETRAARRGGGGVSGVGWLESGRVVDGVAAAVVAECERTGRKATAVVVSPEMVVGKVLEDLVGGGVETVRREFDSGLYS